MDKYSFRPATLKDIDFIVNTIIEAEKSGTDKLGLATLFNLTEDNVREYLHQILEEEIDGCEFSISSFLVAEYRGKCVAAVGGWKEGDNEDELPSAILKANLLGYILPHESIAFTKKQADIIKGIQIERVWGSYQIEYVYVDNNHRGQNLAGKLINLHIEKSQNCKNIYVQTFSNNNAAIHTYKKMGFIIDQIYTSDNSEIEYYLPYNQKLLMKKTIQ